MELCSNSSLLNARKIEPHISNFTQLGQKQYLSFLKYFFFFHDREDVWFANDSSIRKARYLIIVINTIVIEDNSFSATLIFFYTKTLPLNIFASNKRAINEVSWFAIYIVHLFLFC